MYDARIQALRSLGAWLVLAAATPFGSLAVWRWLASQPSSGCFGLEDGASVATFTTAVLCVALELDPEGAACISPALVLPLVGLAVLVLRPSRRSWGWTMSVLGFAAHAVTAVALVSTGC